MKVCRLVQDGRELVPKVWMATSWTERMRGLIGYRGLPPGSAMLLKPCHAIHTFGMCFTLDVIYLDAQQRVLRVVKQLPPFHFSQGGSEARSVLECQTGWFAWERLHEGVPLSLIPIE